MATTQVPQDDASGQAAAARPDDIQSLKHHNQLLLVNLNASRKALAEARQNEQRSQQLYEQVQAQLLEREQAATATLAAFQAQLAEAGVREQRLLALLQQEQERVAASASTAGEPEDSGARDAQLLTRIDALQQALLDQLAQQTVSVSTDPEALEAARQREQALAAQVDQLQQALADKERALEAAIVLQQMDEVVNKGRQIMAGLGPLQQHLESQGKAGEALQAVHDDLRQVMMQALSKMDTLLQEVAAQAEKLEQLGKQAPPITPLPPTGNRSRFAADDHFVLDLPSDLLARTGAGTEPEAQDVPLP